MKYLRFLDWEQSLNRSKIPGKDAKQVNDERYIINHEYCGPNRGILADVIVYTFAHLHRALRTEGKSVRYKLTLGS